MTEWNVLKCKQNHAIDEGNEYCNIFMNKLFFFKEKVLNKKYYLMTISTTMWYSIGSTTNIRIYRHRCETFQIVV